MNEEFKDKVIVDAQKYSSLVKENEELKDVCAKQLAELGGDFLCKMKYSIGTWSCGNWAREGDGPFFILTNDDMVKSITEDFSRQVREYERIIKNSEAEALRKMNLSSQMYETELAKLQKLYDDAWLALKEQDEAVNESEANNKLYWKELRVARLKIKNHEERIDALNKHITKLTKKPFWQKIFKKQ